MVKKFKGRAASLAASLAILTTAPAFSDTKPKAEVVVYIQESWPKQTETNRQIGEISSAFYTEPALKDWGDKRNINVGADGRFPIKGGIDIGVRADFSYGKLENTVLAQTPYGATSLYFKQEFSYYFDVLPTIRKSFGHSKTKPFVLVGMGLFWSKDNTLAELTGLGDLKVENSSFGRVMMAEGGISIQKNKLVLEAAAGYNWAHHDAVRPAKGTLASLLAPGGYVKADNNLDGPYVRIGLGYRF